MKVTILSGFLGAGKTTLLRHLLLHSSDMRVAVIVNDMAAMNVDAELVKTGAIAQLSEKPELIQMQNGCICCTLRMDLLRALASLARSKKFDYCIIESTGISEPMQVAETFMLMVQAAEGQEELKEMFEETEVQELTDIVLAKKPEDRLAHLANLDACVTVIDAMNFLETFEDSRVVADVESEEFAEDDRALSDLMVDQVEFADVIMLNKTDLVSKETLERIRGVITQLNPGAKLVTTQYSRIDPAAVLNTGLFDYAKAVTHAGWLQSVHGKMVPETEEYGVSSFVYRQRRPFHPKRLHELLVSSFIVQEFEAVDGEEEEDEEEEEEEENGDDDDNEEKNEGQEDDSAESKTDSSGNSQGEMGDRGDDKEMTREEIQVHARDKKQKSVFKSTLRSKGFFWLATRPSLMGEWSQAGLMLTIRAQGPWLCEMSAEDLAELDENLTKQDLGPNNDDRRQELVFIGAPLNQEELEKALDACLVADEEWKDVSSLEDPFEAWIDGDDKEEDNENEEEDKRMQGKGEGEGQEHQQRSDEKAAKTETSPSDRGEGDSVQKKVKRAPGQHHHHHH